MSKTLEYNIWINKKRLSLRENLILKLRKSGWTLQKIGNEIGLTRERVRQLQNKALDKLLDTEKKI